VKATPSTTLADEGFLSDETDAVVTTIRAKYVSWFSELRVLKSARTRNAVA
jgi:hypothetical protein